MEIMRASVVASLNELNIKDIKEIVYNPSYDELYTSELDENLKPIKHYYLGDQEALAAKLQAVANQGKAK